MNKINWWQVAAYILLVLTTIGFIISLLLDGDALQWTTPVFTSLLWVRYELVLFSLTEARETNNGYEEL